MQNVKDRFQIQVYNIINESVNYCSQFISVKVKKNLRKSQAQFREKLRKLRLRQNNDFLIKKNMYFSASYIIVHDILISTLIFISFPLIDVNYITCNHIYAF